ncbi:MAG TPA: glycosyltransferase family 39 protein [Gemmatimonadaceae bacterium]
MMVSPPRSGSALRSPEIGDDVTQQKSGWLMTAVLIVIGLVLRLQYLSQPMRYDESVTYLYFATRPWLVVFASYRYPNNHILHTALVKAVTGVFGNAPWAIRLPAFAFGLAIVALTFAVGRRLVGVRAAWIGTAIVAASGPMILYSTNARGYSLVGCATLTMLLLLLRLRERASRRDWIGVVIAATLGVWAIPVMLYPAGGLALWFLWSAFSGDTSNGRNDIRRLIVAVAGTAVATAVVYSPVILAQGVHPIVGNSFVTASTWSAFVRDLSAAVPDLWSSWSIGVPRIITLALLVLAIVGEVASRRDRRRRVSVAGAMSLWCVVLLLATHRVPFVRVALFALPLVALLSGLGITTLLSQVARVKQSQNIIAAGSIAPAVLLSVSVVISRAVLASTETGTLRDAPAITQFLATTLHPGDRVLAPVPSSAPLEYYFVRSGLDASYLTAEPKVDGNVYLVVNVAEGFTINSPLHGEPFLQRFNDASLLRGFPATSTGAAATPSAELYHLLSK